MHEHRADTHEPRRSGPLLRPMRRTLHNCTFAPSFSMSDVSHIGSHAINNYSIFLETLCSRYPKIRYFECALLGRVNARENAAGALGALGAGVRPLKRTTLRPPPRSRAFHGGPPTAAQPSDQSDSSDGRSSEQAAARRGGLITPLEARLWRPLAMASSSPLRREPRPSPCWPPAAPARSRGSYQARAPP